MNRRQSRIAATASLLWVTASAGLVFGGPLRKPAQSAEPDLYHSRIAPIFAAKCASCHDQREGLPFYGKIGGDLNPIRHEVEAALQVFDFQAGFPFASPVGVSQIGLLEALISDINRGSMPPKAYRLLHPSSTLSEDDRQNILNWVQLTLPSLEIPESGGVVPGPSAKARKVLGNRCFACHNSGSDNKFQIAGDLNALTGGAWVKASVPEDAKIYRIVKRDKMPPKNPLSDQEKQILLEWLKAGALATDAQPVKTDL